MFMADVAVGKAFKTYESLLDPANNECPPPGYDAVMGEVREDELCSYRCFVQLVLFAVVRPFLFFCVLSSSLDKFFHGNGGVRRS